MSETEELLQNNAAYAESFEKGDLPLPPARAVAVVACMDARLDVHKILGAYRRVMHMSSATLEGS
jgi:carbonic anhydrase